MVGVLVSVGGLGREAALSIALLDRSISYGSVVIVGRDRVRGAARARAACGGPGGDRRDAVKALVTGGAGFIGSTLVDALVAAGAQVSVVDDLSRGSARRSRRAPTSTSSTSSTSGWRRWWPRSPRRSSSTKPRRSTSAARSPSRCSTHASTCSALSTSSRPVRALGCAGWSSRRVAARCTGTPPSCPRRRATRAAPASAYGAAKLAGETYGTVFAQVHGLEFVALRYANVYGPRQDPHGEAGVVAIFAQRLLDGDDAVINGDGEPDARLRVRRRRRRRQPPRRGDVHARRVQHRHRPGVLTSTSCTR